MIPLWDILILLSSGFGAGIVAGLMGIGGGTLMVPILIALGHSPVAAVATSGLAILVTSISGTWQNYRMGFLQKNKVLALALPSLLLAPVGVYLANWCSPKTLLCLFTALLLINIPLISWGNRIKSKAHSDSIAEFKWTNSLMTGSLAGLLAGLFGIGGGVIMVPFQILFFREKIKQAIQTSLAVIVITSLVTTFFQTWAQQVQWIPGLILGFGGLWGATLSSRHLPKLSDQLVSILFRTLLLSLALYIGFRAYGA